MNWEMLNVIVRGLRRDKKSQNKTGYFSSDNYQSIKELKIYSRKYVLETKHKLSEKSQL